MTDPTPPKKYWIFYKTDDGWRTAPLRDLDWNERIAFVFAAIALVTIVILKGLGAI